MTGKTIILTLFAATLQLSCSNPKVKIVERQKSITRQIAAYKDSISKAPTPDVSTREAMVNSAVYRYYKKISLLEKEHDSLEIELKKY
jgi:hypothetical protein